MHRRTQVIYTACEDYLGALGAEDCVKIDFILGRSAGYDLSFKQYRSP
jgi:hypothetical protein